MESNCYLNIYIYKLYECFQLLICQSSFIYLFWLTDYCTGSVEDDVESLLFI